MSIKPLDISVLIGQPLTQAIIIAIEQRVQMLIQDLLKSERISWHLGIHVLIKDRAVAVVSDEFLGKYLQEGWKKV